MKYNFPFFLLYLYIFLIVGCKSEDLTVVEKSITIDHKKVEEAFNRAGSFSHTKSITFMVDGQLIKEVYYNNSGNDIPHDVRSITKSIITILSGIAVEKGFIKSIDQNIGEYLIPIIPTIDSIKSRITIRDLLTMSAGFGWNELSGNDYSNWINSSNQLEYVLNRNLIFQPGHSFTYNSAALHILSIIISTASKMTTKEFAQIYLFDPLEIGSRDWSVDKQGFNNGGAGLSLTPTDMRKIGLLVLNQGVFNNKQIISRNWIDEMASAKISTQNVISYGNNYGYGWWIGEYHNKPFCFAMGWGGQFIIIVPHLKIVVTATSNWMGLNTNEANTQWSNLINLILREIIPSVK
jgi:CubicO group peptidase (beta-lactamase class C family)